MKEKNLIFKINIIIILILLMGFLPVYLFTKNSNIKKSSGALESLQWLSKIRAYPDVDVPSDEYYKAFEYSKNYLSNVIDKDFPDNWESIGPNNIGGRSLCLAVHPVDTGIIFIGSASGGLWKSTSGGLGAEAWTMVNTGYPSLAVSSIAIDSANPNIMYIGTGENYGYQYSLNGLDIRVTRGMYGIGILKTTNGGLTWNKSLDWSYQNQTGIWEIIINPKNSNILYAATSEGIFKSTNAGGNWVQILNYKMVIDIMINPIDTNIVYASIGNLTNNAPTPLNERGIFKSTNSGVNWFKLTGGLPGDWSGKANLDMYKGNPNFIYVSICNDVTSYVGFYRSTNAGANWTLGSTSVPSSNQGWYNNGIIVKPDNPNVILVGTINVEKSTNGGTSFSTKSSWSSWYSGATPPGQPEGPANFVHADVHNFAVNPKDPNKVYIITDGGLYRSNNFAESNSFYSCNGGYITSQFYASFANSFQDSNYCIGGLQDNRSAFYQGSVAWYKTFMGDGLSSAVNSLNDNIVYTEYVYGDIYKSTNRGINWTDVSPPNSGSSSYYCFVAPYICCKSNPNVLYAGSIGMYKSTTGGGNWTGPYGYSIMNAKILSMAVSYFTTDTIYVGTIPASSPAGIFRSVDGGLNWINITGNSMPNKYPTDISINPNNSKEVYVTFGGFGNSHIFKSTNSGNNWIDITNNLPNVPHQCVIIDPLYPNIIYTGNDLGVYASTNSGQTWGEFRTGMPYSLVFDLTISFPNRKLRATTHGNGVWQRNLVSTPLHISSNENNPEDYILEQNYPNPFNQLTKISFQIPVSEYVKIKVFNISGLEIATIMNERKDAGKYNIQFDASNLSSGIYFYRMEISNKTFTKKMILIK